MRGLGINICHWIGGRIISIYQELRGLKSLSYLLALELGGLKSLSNLHALDSRWKQNGHQKKVWCQNNLDPLSGQYPIHLYKVVLRFILFVSWIDVSSVTVNLYKSIYLNFFLSVSVLWITNYYAIIFYGFMLILSMYNMPIFFNVFLLAITNKKYQWIMR